MFVLGLAICAAGIAAALLPAIPVGTKYWAILLTLSFLYPIGLTRTFKHNRADYEFRLLHWFPAGIFLLWFALQLIGPRIEIIRILALGFFFLWSLPLVALGIAFICIFAVHVLRRSRLRVTTLVVFLSLFTVGALYAEGTNLNPRLQAVVFPKNPPTFAAISAAFSSLRASLGLKSGTSGVLIAVTESSSSSASIASSRSKSAIAMASSQSSGISSSFHMPSSFSSSVSRSTIASLPPVIGDKNPGHLTKSGPEGVAVLGLTLLAGYFGLLHARAKKRV